MPRAAKAAIAIGCVLAALGCVAACVFALWGRGAFLPEWVEWDVRYLSADLDDDGQFESIILKDQQLCVEDGSTDGALTSVELPHEWLVSDVAVADVDHDGVQEVVALTWKQGSFGPSHPFWIEHDSWDLSEHVFIFQYDGEALKHHWLSSDVRMGIAGMQIDDLGRIHLFSPEGTESVCEWDSWGLTFIDEENPSQWEAAYEAVSMLCVGDAIPHEGILKGDGEESLAPLEELVSAHDHGIVNLEAPLVADPEKVSGSFPQFAAPLEFGDALRGAGFDIFTLANNHIADAGEEGIADTLAYLAEQGDGVVALGVGEANAADPMANAVHVIEDGELRIGLLNCGYGLNDGADPGAYGVSTIDEAAMVSQLQEMEDTVDASVCLLHLGEEYADAPTEQTEVLVQALADAGADVILCSHPHVTQRAERLETASGATTYVAYSLGNLIANQPDPDTILGLAASFTIEKPKAVTGSQEKARVSRFAVIPTVCHFADGQTSVMALTDYTEDLARSHHLNALDPGAISLEALEARFRNAMQ